MSSLIHDIKHTFFGVKPKLSNIKEALIVFSGPPFDIQLFAKGRMFGRILLHPNSLPLRLSFRNIWEDKNKEIDHKRQEYRPQSDFYMVMNLTISRVLDDFIANPRLATNLLQLNVSEYEVRHTSERRFVSSLI
jgi:hypothetical protein